MFECEKTFTNAIQLNKVGIGSMFDMLECSYSADHPTFHKCHLRLTKLAFSKPEYTEQVLFTRHFVPLVMRAMSEDARTVTTLLEHLKNTGRLVVLYILMF